MRLNTLIILFLYFLGSCGVAKNSVNSKIDLSLEESSTQVINILKNSSFGSINSWICKNDSIVIAPYAYIDKDAKISILDLNKLIKNKDMKRFWGYYDGTGDSIILNMEEYHSQFIYSKDFEKLDTSINQYANSGNSLNNVKEVWPKASFVDYFYPGTEKFGQMDWALLRLVFEKRKNSWCLLAVIHDQWTI